MATEDKNKKENQTAGKADAVTTKSGNKPNTVDVKNKKGLYNFTFSENHGNYSEGDEVEMHGSTAKALEAHGIGKIGEKVKFVKKEKR